MVKIWNIILLAILAIAALLLAFKLLRSMVKAIFTVVLLAVVGLGIFGLILYSDFSQLQDTLVDNTTFVLEKDGVYLANVKPVGEELEYYTEEEVNNLINDSEELFIVIQYDFLITDETEVELPVQNIILNEELEDIFLAESTEEFLNIIRENHELIEQEFSILENSIEQQYENIDELKSNLLIAILVEDENFMRTIIEGAGKGEVKFRPNFLSLRFITSYPDVFLDGEELE